MSSELSNAKITSIELLDHDKQGYSFNFINQKSAHSLDSVGHVNIFVGPNNSGKSRLMRLIANSAPQRFAYDLPGFSDIQKLLNDFQANFKKEVVDKAELHGIVNINVGVQLELRKMDFSKYKFSHLEEDRNNLGELASILGTFLGGNVSIASYQGVNPGDHVLQAAINEALLPFREKLELLSRFNDIPPKRAVCYIPTMRSLNNFNVGGGSGRDDFIAKRIRENYGLTEGRVDIFTGQNIYVRIREMLLGEQADREKIASYEKFLGEKLFDGDPVTLIPKTTKDVIDVKIGDQAERSIYELGDGIQSLIILTFPLYEYDQGLFFIEEPELNLHPGMQRKLLEVLKDKKQHQYFLTTHSNHFLDLTIQYKNVSVYRCHRDGGKCNVDLVAFGDRSILEELGAQNTSVFLTNNTIWVEGITDRLYISKFIELYLKKEQLKPIIQDIDFSFVEYGGNNIVHWSFVDKLASGGNSTQKINAERLCGQMIVIADADSIGSKTDRKKTLKNELKDRFIELDVREVENLLTPGTLAAVVNSYEGADISLFEGIDSNDYKNELLGSYIDNLFITKSLKRLRGTNYATDSGTLKDKVAFCKKALDQLNSFDDMSKEAQAMTKNLYNFISSTTAK